MLKNPATGGLHWFHGTPKTFGEFRHTDSPEHADYRQQAHPAWNSGIGHHFTSLHDVANAFVTDGSGAPNPHGWHIHAKLGIENPKHYASEHDMLHHAAQVVDPDHEHQRVFHHPSGEVHNIPVSYDDEDFPMSTETHLKMRPKSAQKFREHLISQGHDGITYGNEFEGPKGHTCAIVFHRDQIKEADRHAGHAPDLPDSHVAKKKKHHKNHKGHPHHRVVLHPQRSGYHPLCTGYWHGGWCGGGYGIGHDSWCGYHGVGTGTGGAGWSDGGGGGGDSGGGDSGGSI